MAGQLKVGGNIIASHSGVEGAGEVTLQNATLNSGVVFPAGHVIQVRSGTYNTQTSIGTTATAVITLTFNTVGTNSTFYAHAVSCVGASADNQGYFGGICLKEGSAVDFRSPMQVYLGTAYNQDDGGTSNVGNALFGNDYGNGFGNGYQILNPSFSAEKETTIAAGTEITVALWFRGVNTLYINRSSNRASHEGAITRLVVHEVQS
jgi:hypothetical protein